ncbi:T9SS type A sorting domain-containing protein [Flavobacterium humi]|uniref:T9SS type A sorting domain-containing protein n=1 Tax=Flavobacterium humi TaxID=2562683 RepID=A0A4Z0LA01_9FLAO|nr:T9SS type A sorting domain-containing protein [Flavobacterium humi]TGD58452.1 T9SS type A sorting domain-containing protein [Flavobacterium humi]
MKKTIVAFSILFFALFTITAKGQTPSLQNISVNGAAVSNCGTIAFGSNSSVNLSLTLKITKSSSTNVGAAILKLYIKKTASSTPQFINGIMVDNSAFSQGTSWEGSFSQTLQASDINVSGSTFYGVYEVSTNVHPNTCTYALTKNPSPTFNLVPATQVVYCENLSGYTFTVDNVYATPGTMTYQWNVGNGWKYNNSGIAITGPFTTTTNSIQIRPIDFTVLPSSIQVTPVLNGVSQPTKTCQISRSNFAATQATISGRNSICGASEVYTIENLSTPYYVNTVTWSSSNPAIATVSSATGSSITVTKVSDGACNLIARITNACGQSLNVVKPLRVGGGLPSFDIELTSNSNYAYAEFVTANGVPLNQQGITATTWTNIGSTNGGMGSGSGFEGSGRGPNFNWTVTFLITATNDCGTTSITRTITCAPPPYNPCDRQASLSVSKDEQGHLQSRIILDPPCSNKSSDVPEKEKTAADEIIATEIYDLSGLRIKAFKTGSYDISDLKKGIYIVKVATAKDSYTAKIAVD